MTRARKRKIAALRHKLSSLRREIHHPVETTTAASGIKTTYAHTVNEPIYNRAKIQRASPQELEHLWRDRHHFTKP